MACADVDMDIHGGDEVPRRARQKKPPMTQRYQASEQMLDNKGQLHDLLQKNTPMIRHYQASELILDNKGPLHDLLQKQPAVLGSLQMVSGLLTVGLGIVFAVTQDMQQSLFTLFRVSHLTGALFISAGFLSNLLFKYPGLLPVSLVVNCGCIIVAVASACLISVDLAHWSPENDQHLRMEVLGLCVLGLEVFLSAVLCFWFSKERQLKKKSKFEN